MAVPSDGHATSTADTSSRSRHGTGSRLRGAVDRRLIRMREGMPWARNANALIVESYGNIVDLDLGWRMADATLQQHRSGEIILDAKRFGALSSLWESLTAEIINMPGRDEPDDAREMANELGAAVHDRLQRMSDEMRRDERSAMRLTHDFETLIDLDLSWRLVEQTLTAADQGDIALERGREEALRENWRELTTELVAILGRHQNEEIEQSAGQALDNLFIFKRAA